MMIGIEIFEEKFANMSLPNFEKPLTDFQLEMLQTFAIELSEKELREVKDLIAKFFMDMARTEATRIWDERGYNEETVRKWLNKEYD